MTKKNHILTSHPEAFAEGSGERFFAFAQNDEVLQRGRSMVEMLGVLAVIGVLSVAGVGGYTSAMNQHRANEAINRAMRAAVMLSAQRLANPNATLNTSDLGDGITVGSDTDKLVLTLSNVDEKVRSRIEAMGFKNATIGSDGNGALTFTFNNDLSERPSGSSSGNTSGESGQQEPETPVDPCNGHGTYNGTICTCTDNYYGDTCENTPLTCEHGSWDTTNHICDCYATGYDGDRCQNEVVINKDNFTGLEGPCPCEIEGMFFYCIHKGRAGLLKYVCGDVQTYPNRECYWFEHPDSGDDEDCTWIEE